jgi:hypothetical protein
VASLKHQQNKNNTAARGFFFNCHPYQVRGRREKEKKKKRVNPLTGESKKHTPKIKITYKKEKLKERA